MSIHLLARTGPDGALQFWEGRMWPDGSPVWTPFRHRAFHFCCAGAAYDAANTHKALRNSDEWKAVPR